MRSIVLISIAVLLFCCTATAIKNSPKSVVLPRSSKTTITTIYDASVSSGGEVVRGPASFPYSSLRVTGGTVHFFFDCSNYVRAIGQSKWQLSLYANSGSGSLVYSRVLAFYFNEAYEHHHFGYNWMASIPAGTYQVRLNMIDSITTFDANDYITMVAHDYSTDSLCY